MLLAFRTVASRRQIATEILVDFGLTRVSGIKFQGNSCEKSVDPEQIVPLRKVNVK